MNFIALGKSIWGKKEMKTNLVLKFGTYRFLSHLMTSSWPMFEKYQQ
jgi:hypothetical protein